MSDTRHPTKSNHLPELPRLAGLAAILLGTAMLTGVAVSARQEPAAAPPQATAPAAVPAAVPKDHPEFPAGPGRDTTLRLCSKCHSPNNILAMGRERQGWADLITKMVDFGAQGTDEEFTQVLDYLTASFPPSAQTTKVNVNKAPAAQLAAALTLTTDEAKQLVAYREKNGDYKTIDDLKKVPDVDAKKLDAKKDAITF